MAEEKYSYLGCVTCGAAFKRFSQTGRARHKCNACRERGRKPLGEYQAARRNPANWFTCEWCSKESHHRTSSTNRGNGYSNRWCSMACRSAQAERAKAIQALVQAIKRIARVRAKTPPAVYQPRISTRICVQCGVAFQQRMGRPRIYCSRAYRRVSDVFCEGRRASKAARRARRRGLPSECFSPQSVFMRDGWRCQVCGVSTPQSRRGTRHANAPELDHIIPLSKGGPHTKSNTQCTCRACNQWKSDQRVVGQAGLFA